jgi:hypothetical protein
MRRSLYAALARRLTPGGGDLVAQLRLDLEAADGAAAMEASLVAWERAAKPAPINPMIWR